MLVKPIANLFSLMDFFVRARRPLSVRDIVAEFSWPRSSVFNMVSTMVEHGYLHQPVPRGGYYPTTRWMELARDLSESQPLPESVHKLLVELANRTGETLFLAAAEGTSAVFLDVVESSADIRFIANVGQRLPIHVTAAGRAILAQYSPTERAATLKRIKYQRYEKDTFMTPESVERDVRESARNGWYVNPGIYAPGVAWIAVPFPFRGRRNAIALGGPVSRIEKRVDSIGALLREAIDRFLKDNE
ncbi:MAG: IclR family transcriptional regulator [Gammaproteobacteria bacterium]|nr:IclR family transcriptional regulator [Gammaproteobacteria bacterium]